jgi:N-terminal acetyltransferase B complex non-catalytic subunit
MSTIPLVSSSLTPRQENVDALQRAINVHKLLRYNISTSELTVPLEQERLKTYVDLYEQALPLGADLAATERQPADDFALLAGNTFVSMWHLTKDQAHLEAGAAFLEYALNKSKQSFFARLILIRIYRLLGAPALALEHYRAMGIKQVQNDTLSHLLLSRSSTFSSAPTGDLSYISECLEATQIYLSNSQEVSEASAWPRFHC